MNKQALRMITKAITLCEENEPDRGRQTVVAILTDKKNNVISIGHNSYEKTHPTQWKYAQQVEEKKHSCYLHAEVDALTKDKKKKGEKLFVARVYRDGSFALAKPCPLCEKAIEDSGIKEVIYTTKNGIRREMKR